ncbi:hypothetical protein Y032_0492g2425 [Ancylostoma ceylanicum]|uniref:Uncharacterized protein n=1 Tax=Ancylostoma ceylanicum TaxID=53326 RepID=A0A016WW66_9BILA|nr:hypothetical protein Y032_0492g2425 [Ancylostoma ceylanicum]
MQAFALFSELCMRKVNTTVGANGSGPSMTSKSARRDRAAHDGIVAAVANLGFLGVFPSHLILSNEKTN